ncbi:putative entry exclusion protein TrbK-alt [Asaia krungthepensis]|uniref:Conjugal transfer protein TrbK n=1 Tax=Asaia krungthepensis NRIC 0535 TaxID=1307925 RepID=A0ABQ0Q2S7_9PROT|nr:putative entry exclusion protein TrbK-alt [Asaia krungthepensis]GBQ88582.1 hypothetical protein AA0535_1576 [Asaia krungthepensis NRIC 0535]
MDGKMLARIGAVVFVGVAITATAIEMTRKPEEPEVRILRPDLDAQTAPSRPMLRRCRDMGEAATRDPACLKAWAENRDRFLKQGSETSIPATDAPSAPATLFPSAPSLGESPVVKESAPAETPAAQPEPSQPPISPDKGVR